MLDRNTAAFIRYDAQKKSVAVAYLFWLFLGWAGGHRFYSGNEATGAAQFVLNVGSAFCLFIRADIAIALAVASVVWMLVDAILIPGLIRSHNLNLADELLDQEDDIQDAVFVDLTPRLSGPRARHHDGLFDQFMDLPPMQRITALALAFLLLLIVVQVIR
ncbi:TM2 domain-containing protein [Robbsia andropogonis]|uniref:TM2 domain-containing protein n=1 Tax=Robbsia andropogonis TaxID=28092 RepID=UPI003D2487E4